MGLSFTERVKEYAQSQEIARNNREGGKEIEKKSIYKESRAERKSFWKSIAEKKSRDRKSVRGKQKSIDSGNEANQSIDIQKARAALRSLGKNDRAKLARKLGVRNNYDSIIKGIIGFQNSSGLTPDGIYGPNTHKKLALNNPNTKSKTFLMGKTKEPIENINTRGVKYPKGVGEKGIERLGGRWKKIYVSFYKKLSEQEKSEVIIGKYPIALADKNSSPGKAIIIDKGKTKIVDAKFSKRGFISGDKASVGDNMTPVGMVQRFNRAIIPKNPYGNASNSGKAKTVVGAALISPEATKVGGRWWHGGTDRRFSGKALETPDTIGCVVLRVEDARKLAMSVKKNGKGFGYVA